MTAAKVARAAWPALFLMVAALMLPAIGLGILGLEFAWARRWLTRVKAAATDLVDGARSGAWRKPKEPIDPFRPR